jgi:hypothetical protein
MKAAIYAPPAMVLAALLSVPAGAPIVTQEQACADGDRTACRLIELANGRDFRTMLTNGAQYRLVLGPRTLWSMLRGGTSEQRPVLVQSACTFYNEVRLGPDIEEYERLSGERAVDSAGYEKCLEVLR